jgi:hypothetical protein
MLFDNSRESAEKKTDSGALPENQMLSQVIKEIRKAF